MRPWKPLLAFCCILSAASVSRAGVLFQGLQYGAQGGAVVDIDASRRLVVHNLGSSGQDGVSVSCLHMDGLRLALDGSCTAADAGASVAMAYDVSVGGVVLTPRLRVSCAVEAGYVDISAGVCALSSSPTQTVTLSRAGVAVYSVDVPAGSAVRVQMDATGSCPNPALFCTIVRKVHSVHRGASLAQPMRVSVAGHDEDCDDIDFSSALDGPDQDCDGVAGELRVSCPAGSSLSSLTCSSGACRVLDHFVEGEGQVQLAVPPPGGPAPAGLRVDNLGSSGQDGVEIKWPRPKLLVVAGGSGVAGGTSPPDGPACLFHYAPPGLVFDPAVDAGAASVMTIQGRAFSSTGADLGDASASLALTIQGSNFYAIPSHVGGGATQEWVAVLSNGVEVASLQLPHGGSVQILPPAGEPQGMAINEKGLPDDKKSKGKSTKSPFLAASGIAPASVQALTPDYSRGHVAELRCPLHVSFAGDRVFVIGGVQVSGDEIECFSDDGSGAFTGTFTVSLCSDFVSCPNPASALSSLHVLDISASGGDPIGPVVSDLSLSSAHTCISLPVMFARTDATPVRAFSATFHLSPELATCGASVVEGDYLSRVAGTQMFVTDNGGGSYTVDCGILGPVCGATGDGTLFTLQLAAAAGVTSAVGSVVMDAVSVRDCSNQSVPADPGDTGYIPIQFAAPPAVSGLTATTQKSGNTTGGIAGGVIAGIVVARPPSSSSPLVTMDVYRKGFGNYPLYDNAPNAGAVPQPPASPAAALADGWSRVTCSAGTCSAGTCASTCTATSVTDLPPSRDFEYYVAFARDQYGNTSPVSNMTPGTLDYFLGDVSDGLSSCTGDDHVDIADVSLLGSHYGSSAAAGSSFACLDVGPTTDFSVDARPTTDGKIGFEDFMMFAINFSVVSAPQYAARPVAQSANAARLLAPSALPGVGGTFDVSLAVDGAGDVQGLSARLTFDPAVLEQVSVTPGSLLDAQGRPSAVLSSGPGDVDAALLGVGPGIAGSGELARVTFRVKAAGEPKLAIAGVSARDASNHAVEVAGVDAGAVADARTGLGILFPNPFRQAVEIRLSQRRDGPAKLAVYDVAGRRVRVLLQGVQPAGGRTVTWDGTDDAGLRMAPGAYVVRFETAEHHEARTIHLVR